MARKAIPKRVRFEVFKRDSFKCQYCGAAAPEVLLQIDHIKPVAQGGMNEIVNLITACTACNAGKSARSLDDKTVVQKSRVQLEELQERREQLEMMSAWLEGLKDLKANTIEKLMEHWHEHAPGFRINENGKKTFQRLIRKHSLEEIYEAMDIAAEQYLVHKDDGTVTEESWDRAFEKVPGICKIRRVEETKPYLADLFYVRGILRKRGYVNERYVMELLENAVRTNADVESLKQLAKNCRSWSDFQNEVHNFIDGHDQEKQRP